VVLLLAVVLVRKRLAQRAPASKPAPAARAAERARPPPARNAGAQSPRPPASDPPPVEEPAAAKRESVPPSARREEAPSASRREGQTHPPLSRRADARARPEDPAEAEALYRRAQAGSSASKADREEVQALGRHAAQMLLAHKDPRRAVAILREVDLADQAIHVYLNVLNDPVEAAHLLAARGDHQRAAELYTAGGKKEEAARAWLEVARAEKDPMRYVSRIQQLNERVAHELLLEACQGKRLDASTVDLHYQLALSHLVRGQGVEALALLERLARVAPGRRDVAERLQVVRRGASSRPVAASSPPTTLPAGASRPPTSLPPGASRPPTSLPPGASRPPSSGPPGTSIPAPDAGDVTQLQALLGGQSCTLANIEVYYKLGVAYEQRNDVARAIRAFEAVEETSPGYRDAEKRLARLRRR
jgi:tetratricopeptide (TPR) repeat protein